MNYKYTFFILIYLFLSSCKNEPNLKNIQNNESQEENIKTEKEKITVIKNNFARVNSTKNWSKKIFKELWESTEGGEANFFYLHNNLEKITEIHYGETGQNLTEYYFSNKKLSFIFEKETHYNRPITYTKELNKDIEDGIYFDINQSEITEIRSYFYDDKLIKQISNIKSENKIKISLENEFLRLKEKLEFIKKIEKTKE
jgi:hypothetical protein